MRPSSLYFSVCLIAFATGVWGCLEEGGARQPRADAVAVLRPTEANTVEGVVRFAKTDKGIRVMARLTNLAPGLHGFHIHEFGDCRASDGTSAGGHFNPTGAPHAGPDTEQRHAGDFGNVLANDDGIATLDLVSELVRLDGPDSVIGRSVIVHADPDDLESQPSGASGARLACGVIGLAAR